MRFWHHQTSNQTIAGHKSQGSKPAFHRCVLRAFGICRSYPHHRPRAGYGHKTHRKHADGKPPVLYDNKVSLILDIGHSHWFLQRMSIFYTLDIRCRNQWEWPMSNIKLARLVFHRQTTTLYIHVVYYKLCNHLPRGIDVRHLSLAQCLKTNATGNHGPIFSVDTETFPAILRLSIQLFTPTTQFTTVPQ